MLPSPTTLSHPFRVGSTAPPFFGQATACPAPSSAEQLAVMYIELPQHNHPSIAPQHSIHEAGHLTAQLPLSQGPGATLSASTLLRSRPVPYIPRSHILCSHRLRHGHSLTALLPYSTASMRVGPCRPSACLSCSASSSQVAARKPGTPKPWRHSKGIGIRGIGIQQVFGGVWLPGMHPGRQSCTAKYGACEGT